MTTPETFPSAADSVVVLWLDGQTCAVPEREGWALTPDEVATIHEAARADGLGAGVVSTCFRVELMVSGEAPDDDLAAWGRQQLAALRPYLDTSSFREARGDGALRHLLRVAAGLESAVLGEAQILGQVRRARAEAEAAGALSPALRAAFDAAVQVGPRVRAETSISRGAASTASAAVRWAGETLGGLEGRHVAVVGAGQIGRLLLKNLAGVGAASVTLVSAHAPAHAGFEVVRPRALPALLPEVDALFTGTDRHVLDADLAGTAWAGDRARAVVDLGVPRNVSSDVSRLPGVALADVDALGAVVDAGLAARRAAIPEAEALVEAALADLREALAALERERLIADFRKKAEITRQEALAYVCDKCAARTCGSADAGPGPGPCSDPERLSKTLTTRLLHDVTAALRSGRGDDETLRQLLALPSDGLPDGRA
ncbi:MAG: glutamyl-tRNA reductase [Bacteroidota bacterium]